MSKQKIAIEELSALVDRALETLGLLKDEREAVAEVLFYAELRCKSQGLIKIVERTVLPAADRTDMEIIDASACIARINANGNNGMLVLNRAAAKAIDLCKDAGFAMVTTCGTASSTGSIGCYAEKIASRGYIGIVFAGSPKVMALHGGASPSMGTNPVAAAFPTTEHPLVIDMATAATTWFDVIEHQRSGRKLPAGVAFDKNGQPTLSATEALQGALKTFGGVKGSALALMFEALTGPLTGASMLGDELDSRGNLLIAINPSVVLGTPDFQSNMSEMITRMRETGASLPGDRSRARLEENLGKATLSIDSYILEELRHLAGQTGH